MFTASSIFIAFCILNLAALRAAQYNVGPTYLPVPAAPAAPIISKQFYTVTAAEEPVEQQVHSRHLVIGRPMRNYRVIFIRAPSAEQAQVKYTAEVAPQEERTVIYVLTRKQKELSVEDIAAPVTQQQASKPDVFFIKYKTNEEAAAAQREIQTQYDQLGGNTEHAAPYVAPVQSVGTAATATVTGTAGTGTAAAAGYQYGKPSWMMSLPASSSSLFY